MEKRKGYYNVRFPARVIEEAHDLFLSQLDTTKEIDNPTTMRITIGDEEWNFDTRQEFLSEYLKADEGMFRHREQECDLILHFDKNYTSVTVGFSKRSNIESIFQIFERNLDESKLIIVTESEPLTIFIGHGHDLQWRDLKDHLVEQHGFNASAYEMGPVQEKVLKMCLKRCLMNLHLPFLFLPAKIYMLMVNYMQEKT